jgi:hypothetical protein
MNSPDRLRHLRNDLPMPVTLAALGPDGPVSKRSDGVFRFGCPPGGEMQAAVNPRNNLAHGFGGSKNRNNIDVVRRVTAQLIPVEYGRRKNVR